MARSPLSVGAEAKKDQPKDLVLRGRELRVVVPVDMRAGTVDLRVGNRVSSWFVDPPLGESRPLRRFERIRAQTRRLKRAQAAQAIDGFLRFADWTGSTGLTFLGVNLIGALRPYNLIVTNVPGPQVPLYSTGARLVTQYGLGPVFDGMGLIFPVFSYCGHITVSFTSCRDMLPDPEFLAECLQESFEELRDATVPATQRTASVA